MERSPPSSPLAVAASSPSGSSAGSTAQAASNASPEVAPPEASPFWRKPLAALTKAEWESLCDGCGRCCLVKLEDEDTGNIHFTDVGCTLLDSQGCHCSDYPNRQTHVPDCVKLTPEVVHSISWLPPTCAYRLVAEGRDLMWWHPLVSGSPASVHEAGISVRGKVAYSEDDLPVEDLPDRIVLWPNRWPKRARKAPVDNKPLADGKPLAGNISARKPVSDSKR